MSGFWLYMFVITLLIPLMMIFLGKSFIDHPPKNINSFFGYRTALSKKNQDTWRFAHKHCGTIWMRSGMCLLPVVLFFMLPARSFPMEEVAVRAVLTAGVEVLTLVGSCIPTQIALKRTFDAQGRRKA